MAHKNTEVLDRIDDKTDHKKPQKYKVLLLNDEYTTMEFVIEVLMRIFHHSQASATRTMLGVHNSGTAIAGVFTREIAETKVAQVETFAKKQEHPLQASIEPE